MAEPTDAYPEEATNATRPREDGDGEAALRAAIDAHGADLAAVLDQNEHAEDLLETAILIVASANEDDVEYLTESTANLVHALEGLSTEPVAELAADVGENGDDLAAALETVLAMQREGHLDDFVAIATAFSSSLSPEEVEKLAGMLDDDASEVVEALDVVLELQREEHLEDLVALATTLSTLEIDDEAARGLNTVLGAIGEAERESEPIGIVGMLRGLRSKDARAGLGYLLALLKAQGRRVRR